MWCWEGDIFVWAPPRAHPLSVRPHWQPRVPRPPPTGSALRWLCGTRSNHVVSRLSYMPLAVRPVSNYGPPSSTCRGGGIRTDEGYKYTGSPRAVTTAVSLLVRGTRPVCFSSLIFIDYRHIPRTRAPYTCARSYMHMHPLTWWPLTWRRSRVSAVRRWRCPALHHSVCIAPSAAAAAASPSAPAAPAAAAPA